eukprot:434531-Prymnesium_polylepis.1
MTLSGSAHSRCTQRKVHFARNASKAPPKSSRTSRCTSASLTAQPASTSSPYCAASTGAIASPAHSGVQRQ